MTTTTATTAPTSLAAISGTSTAGATSGTGAASTTPATTQLGTGSGTADYNRFLTLLTAQLKYQDPLSPQDPTQFVAQLAQFSSVEQQVQANSKLDSIAKALTASSLTQYAGMLGHNVQSTAASITVPSSGSAPDTQFQVSNGSLKNIRMVVTDGKGKEVAMVPVTGANGTVSFNGTGVGGVHLPAGSYGIKLVGDDSNSAEQSAGTLSTSGKVTQVMQGSGGTWQLLLDDGRTVDASGVTGIAS